MEIDKGNKVTGFAADGGGRDYRDNRGFNYCPPPIPPKVETPDVMTLMTVGKDATIKKVESFIDGSVRVTLLPMASLKASVFNISAGQLKVALSRAFADHFGGTGALAESIGDQVCKELGL